MREKQFRTALYGRTSKDDPKKVTIEIQQKALQEWAGRDPLVKKVVGEYWDDGVTGKVPLAERPEGRRLLQDVLAGKIDSVAVAYADRFGRTLLDGLQAVKGLEDAGVKLVAVNDGWDARRNDSPLYFQFRMMMAEEEHRRIGQRMREGKLRAMDRDNAPPGGPLVFGYRLDAHGRFVADPVEAPIVIHVFEMALAGRSHQEILAWVRTTGVPAGRKFQKRLAGSAPVVVANHRTAAWHNTKVGKILRSRVYVGERKWGDRVFACTALIDPDSFAKVQAILATKSGSGVGKNWDPARGLLTGVLTCKNCGGTFYHKLNTVRRRANGRLDYYPTYMCDRARRNWGGCKCKAKMLMVRTLDAQVWAVIEEYLDAPERLVKKALATDAHLGDKAAELDAEEGRLVAQVEAMEQEANQVWQEQRANSWPVAWVTPRLNELNARREKLAAQLADVRKRQGNVLLDREKTASVVTHLAGIRDKLRQHLTPHHKRDLIKLLLAGGTVETKGTGRQKTAEVTIFLKWGEQLAMGKRKLTYPSEPKDWSNGQVGYAAIPCVIDLAAARQRRTCQPPGPC